MKSPIEAKRKAPHNCTHSQADLVDEAVARATCTKSVENS